MHRFADWPNPEIPKVCAGVYSVYQQDGAFIYVGMAGAELTPEKIERKQSAKKQSGLRDRLNSHASGQRSGDRFNIYIADLYVLNTLSQDQIDAISSGQQSMDRLVRSYIREHLSYRFIVTDHSLVRQLEAEIQSNGLGGVKPLINGR